MWEKVKTVGVLGKSWGSSKNSWGSHFMGAATEGCQNFIFRTENYFCVLAVEYSLVFNFEDAGQPSLCKNSSPLDQQVNNNNNNNNNNNHVYTGYPPSLKKGLTGVPVVKVLVEN